MGVRGDLLRPREPAATTLSDYWGVPDLSDGHCIGVDPDSWFPDDGSHGVMAIKICRGCPVRALCLNWALDHPEMTADGVWGGTTPRERRRIRRDARVA